MKRALLLLLLASVAFAAPPTEILSAAPLVGFQQDGCKAVLSFRFEMDNGWAAGGEFTEDTQTYKLSLLLLEAPLKDRWEACGAYETDCEPGLEPVIYNPQDLEAKKYHAKLVLLKVGQVNEVLDSTYLTFDLSDMPVCGSPVDRVEGIEIGAESVEAGEMSAEKMSPVSGDYIPPELRGPPVPPAIRQPSPGIDATAIALLVAFLALTASTVLFIRFSR